MVEAVHQLAQFVGIAEVGGVVKLGGLAHPGQVGAGREVLAAPAQDKEADLRVGLHLGQCGVQLADHLGVEGIVLVGTVQPQGGDAVRILMEFDGLENGHLKHPRCCCCGRPGLGALGRLSPAFAAGARLPQGARYMRNTPKLVGSMGALSVADSASASTSRVCAGSITPSSHSRALE